MATRIGTVKDAALQALHARKAIANGNFYPFVPALVMAIAKDGLFDLLTDIPIIGLIGEFFSIFIAVFLFVFLFGKGTWKVRLVVAALQFFDIIPVVNLLPMSVLSVAYVYLVAKKKADRARKELPALEGQTNADRIRGYQWARAAAEAEEAERSAQAANDARYQQEAANDVSYRQNLSRRVM